MNVRTLLKGGTLSLLFPTLSHAAGYAVVVSSKTANDAQWRPVVDTLIAKHHATLITYDASVTESLPTLQKQHPKYACFVATPQEAGRAFVSKIHHLTRKLDDDPYADCQWGILTGYDTANALRIAKVTEPLTIQRTASGTEVALDMCVEGQWYDELKKNKTVAKKPNGPITESKGPDDTTKPLADLLTDYKADLFVTSGHATERDWMIGFTYKNGFFKSESGRLYGIDTKQQKTFIDSPNPKVYLAVGNCLMGHVDSTNAMALAFMNSAGVTQMVGYTENTWYGYAGWGMLDYFVEQPGRYTCNEAFMAANHALIHRLQTYFPEQMKVEDGVAAMRKQPALTDAAKAAGLKAQDGTGLLYDRDVLAFYGDPAWQAKMADLPKAYDQSLTEKDGLYTFTITPKRGEKSFAPVNTNGAQRGYRPIVHFFPDRLKGVQLVESNGLNPTIADDFLLIPNPRTCDPTKPYTVTFRAKPID
jgi:hypothetical protein